VGRGAFEFVFARYAPDAGRLRYGFVENEYLQVLCDFGVVGAFLLLLALGLAVWRARPSLRRSTGGSAAAIGLAALALHNAVDFSWEAASIAAAAGLLGALAFPSVRATLAPRLGWVVAAATVFAAGLGATPFGRTADEDVAKLKAAAVDESFGSRARAAFSRHPADSFIADVIAGRMLDAGDTSAVEWIERALLVGPRDPIAHLLAARALLMAGQPAQAVLEVGVALQNEVDPRSAIDQALAIFPQDDEAPQLIAALPPEAAVRRLLVERLAAQGRWAAVETAGRAALEVGDDRSVLRKLVEAARYRHDTAAMATWAPRLGIGAESGDAFWSAGALDEAGQPDAAEALLEAGLVRAPGEIELVAELARVRIGRGRLAEARTQVEVALARAVTVSDKVRLHNVLAEIANREGNPNRAAHERALAARLQEH
jgi:hypothetical protein